MEWGDQQVSEEGIHKGKQSIQRMGTGMKDIYGVSAHRPQYHGKHETLNKDIKTH
jgi:hypothetical protein